MLVAVLVGGSLAAIADLRTRRIPNAITGAMAACGVVLAATGASGVSVGGSVLGFALGLLLMLPGHLLGATGAGDLKLLASVGAIVGPAEVVAAFLFTALVGGLAAVAVALHRGRLGATLVGAGRMVTAPTAARRQVASLDQGSRFTYGPAIALGSLIAVLS